ncbi:hypothetical protein SteCoe_34100 [Stentor coeruleus]|uniref:PIPK domain-containing protein n=1 Tax=Stentor coeruleus TaxID=5963 RepID=A0A1R2AVA7_9CILI|nr:hypothetical protein SteCoe_34735 [Stentor coeruleus]OMJ68448.1 hypothetical protein SteCoe_34100 [Stentor coeruleus]
MLCCGVKKKAHTKKAIEHTILINRYHFKPREIEIYKQKFERMASGSGFSKEEFRKNMSLMEFKVLSSIAEKIFDVMNKSKTGIVTLEEYLSYMDTMIYGTEEEKAIQSFSLIAGPESRGITYHDFKGWVISVWKIKNNLTGQGFSMNDQEMHEYFNKIDTKNDGVIDFEEYTTAINSQEDFADLIDTLKHGLTDRLNVPSIEDFKKVEINYSKELLEIEMKITALIQLIEEEYGVSPTVEHHIPSDMCLNTKSPSDRRMTSTWLDRGDLEDSARRSSRYMTVRIPKDNRAKCDPKMDFIRELLVNLLDKLAKLKEKGAYDYHENEDEQEFRRTWTKSIPRKTVALKKNDVIYWGDDDWNLILNMMLGIQKSVKSTVASMDILSQVTPEMFVEKVKHKLLPSHSKGSKTFKFRDYAPTIFERIRKLYGIKSSDYIRSLGMEKMMHALMANEFSSLTGQCTTGKSGSFFYYSDDGKYMLKTLSEEEYVFFRDFIPDYYFHLYRNPHTLITRFFGFHKIIVCSSRKKLYFVVMGNLFKNEYELDIKYDLKGSTLGRITADNEDKTIARKDNNFNNEGRKIRIGRNRKTYLLEQMEKDVDLMRRSNIIDYSLLVGIANVSFKEIPRKNGFTIFSETDDGGIINEDKTELYFMGIIDILTYYGAKKKLEHFFKNTIHKKQAVSCAPPDFYAERFLEYMERILE